MKKITFLFIVLTLFFNLVSAQTVFDFETATDNGADVTETIDGITVTVTGDPDIFLLNIDGVSGVTGNAVVAGSAVSEYTFTFDQPVDVNSILPIDGAVAGLPMEYTFTPTGGENTPVMVSIGAGGWVDGVSGTEANLNWTGVRYLLYSHNLTRLSICL